MRSALLVAAASMLPICAIAQERSALTERVWYDGDRREVVWMATDEVAAVLLPGASAPLVIESAEQKLRQIEPAARLVKRTSTAVFFEIADGHDVATHQAALRDAAGVAFASPVFYPDPQKSNAAMVLTGEVLVGFSRRLETPAIETFAKRFGVTVLRELRGVPNVFVMDAHRAADLLTLANTMRSAPDVALAMPNWVKAVTTR